MSKKAFRINGVVDLQNKLKQNATMNDVKNVVKMNTIELETVMRRNANFKGHYDWNGKFVSPTGTTRRSVSSNVSKGGMKGSVGPNTEYSPYLEWGTRRMTSQPFVGPSFRIQSKVFISDLERLMK